MCISTTELSSGQPLEDAELVIGRIHLYTNRSPRLVDKRRCNSGCLSQMNMD